MCPCRHAKHPFFLSTFAQEDANSATAQWHQVAALKEDADHDIMTLESVAQTSGNLPVEGVSAGRPEGAAVSRQRS